MRVWLLGRVMAISFVCVAAGILSVGIAQAHFNRGMIDVSFGNKDAAPAGKAVVGRDGDQWNSPDGHEGTDQGEKTDVRLAFDADRTYDATNNTPFAGGPYENLMRHYLVAFWANGYGKGGICLKLAKEEGKVAATVAWTTREMVCHHGGYIIHQGYIYGNHDGGWTCLDLKSGKKMWNTKGVGKGSLCFADDMLYLFSENGGQAALATCSPEGMQLQGKVRVKGNGPSWAHPVVVGGRLYLRYDTHLYCFDVRT